jgi:predicted alpha/beta hydrolase
VSAVAALPLAASFTARDGRRLHGHLMSAVAPRAALVINCATGMLCGFYLKFARYACLRGYQVLLYDYRGMGASAQHPLANEPARMSEWGRLDMPAALDWLADRAGTLPVATLGHSVGGQLIGAMDNAQRARAHVMIAASTGYWRRQHVPFRYQALAFWKLYGPVMLRRHGYVPRGMLWRGESLPPQVFLQWRRWCLSAAGYGPQLDEDLAATRFGDLRGPLLVWGFSDDPIATPRAVAALLESYSGMQVEERWTRPAEAGVRRIGHHGFFYECHRETLWRAALDWLDARLA